MYNCELCGETSGSGEKLNRVAIKFRNQTYNYKVKVPVLDKEGLETGKTKLEERQSKGTEIVQEIDICGGCNVND